MTVTPIIDKLETVVAAAFTAAGLPAERGRVVYSARPDLGQFQCNGAMACAKEAKKNPLEIAETLADSLRGNAMFAEVAVAKPGFLNFTLTDAYLSTHLQAMADDAHLGGYQAEQRETIIMDYGGMNIAKPMHVGHLRTCVLGDVLNRMLTFAGHKVISDIHLGDWGLQMGMLISEIARRQPDLPYFNEAITSGYPSESPVTLEDLETMYPQVAAECKTDEARLEAARAATQQLQAGRAGYTALWQHFIDVSVRAIRRELQRLDVEFDLWNGESAVNDLIAPMVADLKARGIAQESEGAWVIRVEQEGDKQELPPLLLTKSDGAALYATTDLATIKQRVDESAPDRILYVVDQRQHMHFEQVFRGAERAGYMRRSQLEHLGFGTVNGPDGKPFKTRDGGVMKLHDLIQLCVDAAKLKEGSNDVLAEMLAIAALKFADLSSQRIAGYIFDVEKFVSTEGRTGPYLQYACVRVRSMLEKSDTKPGAIALSVPEEKALALVASRFPQALREAIDAREPSMLAEYTYQLAQAFSAFYAACPIAKAEDKAVAAARLGLSTLVQKQVATCLGLMGIPVPEKM